MICVLNNRKIQDYSDLSAIYKHRPGNPSSRIVVQVVRAAFLGLALDSKLFTYEIWQRDILSGECYNSIGAWNITDHILRRVRR